MGLVKGFFKQIAFSVNDKVTEQQLQKNKKLAYYQTRKVIKKVGNMLMEE